MKFEKTAKWVGERLRSRAGGITLKLLAGLFHAAYSLAAVTIVLTTLIVLVAETLNHRDYRDALLGFVQRIDPLLDVEALQINVFRSNLRVTATNLSQGDLSVETLSLSIEWRQLLQRYLAGGAFSGIVLSADGVELSVRENADGQWALALDGAAGDGTVRWDSWRGIAARFDDITIDQSRIRMLAADGAEHIVALDAARLQRDHAGRLRVALRGRARPDAPAPAVVHALIDETRLSATLSVQSLSLPSFHVAPFGVVGALDDINLRAKVHYASAGLWQVSIGPSSLSQHGNRLGVAGAQLNRSHDVLHITTQQLALGPITNFLVDGHWLPDAAHAALDTMRPSGNMHDLQLILSLGDSGEQTRLRARLSDMATSAWRTVPGMSGINGTLNLGPSDGRIAFDGRDATITAPFLYNAPLGPYRRARGRLYWQVDGDRLHLRADPIVFEQHGGGRGRLLIESTANLVDDRQPTRIVLVAGWEDISIAQAREYVPKVVQRDVRKMVEETLIDGSLPMGGLIYRTSLGGEERIEDELQLYAQVRDGVVALASDLSPAKRVNGTLTLDNSDMLFRLDSFEMAGGAWMASGPVHGRVSVTQTPLPGGRAAERYAIEAHNMTFTMPALGERIPNMSLQIDGNDAQWSVVLRHPNIKARMTVPTDPQTPSLLEIRHLAIPELNIATATASTPLKVNNWPNMDVDIQSIHYGKHALGPIYFQIRSTHNKLSLRNVHANIGGALRIEGMRNGYGDHFTWVRAAHGYHSELAARIDVGDLGAELSRFGLRRYLQSRSGQIETRLHWDGDPTAVTLESLSGHVKFHFERGLVEADEQSSGLLRSIAALDLNQWIVQTLKRESRLHMETGIEYQRLEGELDLRKGRIAVKDRIILKNPSTHVSLSGHMNLHTKALNGNITATLPAVENLGWLAMLGGFAAPVVVGVHFVARLFGKQVAQFASARYQIKGTWDEPDIALEQLFHRVE